MSDLLGFITISLVSIITFFIALRWPGIKKIIFTALIVRLIVMLIGHYVLTLPDSSFDAEGFESQAWIYAQDGFLNTLNHYPGYTSWFYPWMIAIPYSIFGRSILMAQSIGLLIGVLTVLLGWLLSKKIWDNNSATKVGWVLALFPSLVLYSVLPLREVYSNFFLVVAMIGVVNWAKFGGYKSIVLAMTGFIGATFFHGVLLIGGIFFLIILGLSNFKKMIELIFIKRISVKVLVITTTSVIFLYLFFTNNIYIPYVGTFEQSINIGWLTSNIEFRMTGDASYSEWTEINSGFEFFYKGIARIIYLLFSPFPWDVKKPIHLIGLFDSLLYIIIIYLIFLNRKAIFKDPALRLIFLIVVSYLFVYGIGTSNFGAGLRHRSKFVIELIILAAPFIPKIVLFKKKRIKEFF